MTILESTLKIDGVLLVKSLMEGVTGPEYAKLEVVSEQLEYYRTRTAELEAKLDEVEERIWELQQGEDL